MRYNVNVYMWHKTSVEKDEKYSRNDLYDRKMTVTSDSLRRDTFIFFYVLQQ
jgi:hypothetical protein